MMLRREQFATARALARQGCIQPYPVHAYRQRVSPSARGGEGTLDLLLDVRDALAREADGSDDDVVRAELTELIVGVLEAIDRLE